MSKTFEIDGKIMNKDNDIFGTLNLKNNEMFINLPEWIEERNIYKVDTKEQFAVLKPKKFGGLTYRIIDFDEEFAEISTHDYDICLVRITEATTLTNYPMYEKGGY